MYDTKINADGTIDVSVTGETGSKLFPANINYDLDVSVDPKTGDTNVTGSHDGYPSYNVKINDKSVYDKQQGHIGQLLGKGDTKANQKGNYKK